MDFTNSVESIFPIIYRNINSGFIKNIKEGAFKSFLQNGFPHSKQEEWKFSSVEKFLPKDLKINIENIQREKIYKWNTVNVDSYKLVFVDGFFQDKLSNIPKNCELNSFDIKDYFTRAINTKDKFLDLNLAISQDGFYLKVPDNVVVDKPVYITNISTDNNFISTHNLIVLGKNSKLEIIEENITKSDITFYNNVTEIFIDDNANYSHYKIQNDDNISCVDNTFLRQNKFSEANVNTFSFRGKFIRNNLNFVLDGIEATSNLNGLSFIRDNTLVDNHTFVHHKEPNCNSNEFYRGIFKDNSKGVFNGKILVGREAQKTNAFQTNNNILLSDNTSVNTKPQLEIFADDVKCSHGCTVGQLDREAIFYLQTRGIPKEKAVEMLVSAFAYEVIETSQNQNISEILKKIILH